MNFPINLVGELVAVKVDTPEGAVRLPDWKRNLSGEVIAHGPGCSKDVVLSSRIAFGAAVGMDSVLNGQEIRILKEQDIDFIYEEDHEQA